MVSRPRPAPQRRRVDKGPVSAEQVALSNATLRHFVGHGQRPNRWMHAGTPPRSSSEEDPRPAEPRRRRRVISSSSSSSSDSDDRGGGKRSRESAGRQSTTDAAARRGEAVAAVAAAAGPDAAAAAAGSGTPDKGVVNSGSPQGASPAARASTMPTVPALPTMPIVPSAPAAPAAASSSERSPLNTEETPGGARDGRQSAASSDANVPVSLSDSSPARSWTGGASTTPTVPTLSALPTAPTVPAGPAAASPSERRPLDAEGTPGSTRDGRQSVTSSDANVPVTLPHSVRSSMGAVRDAASAPRPRPRLSINGDMIQTIQAATGSPRTTSYARTGVPLSQWAAPVPGEPPQGRSAPRNSPLMPHTAHALSLLRHASRNVHVPPPSTLNPPPRVPSRGSDLWPMQTAPHATLPPVPQYFDAGHMMLRVDDQLRNISQARTDDVTYQCEIGRLQLLREAVAKNDGFYVVLNQLSCLRSIWPQALPAKLAEEVSESAYGYLDMLLCKNELLSMALVGWFSSFPASIPEIYSSPRAQVHQSLVDMVVAFLKELPLSWTALSDESMRREAPPLVQDMIERLNLVSPVLQVTAFRAIARSFWGVSPSAEAGIEILVSIHYHDQAAYARGYRASPADKNALYAAYKRVYYEWRAYDQYAASIAADLTMTRDPTAQQRVVAPFYPSTAAMQAFSMLYPPAAPVPSQPPPQQNIFMQLLQQQQQQQQQSQQWVNGPNTALQLQNGNMPAQQQQPPQILQPTPPRHHQTVPPPVAGFAPGLGRVSILPDIRECPRPQPTEPETARIALHQAHLRTPILGPEKPVRGAPVLYRHVKEFPLHPRALEKDKPIQVFTFKVASLDDVPKTVPTAVAGRTARTLTEKSSTYRLRCSRIDKRRGFPHEGSWLIAENVWPETVYFDLNGRMLETRRKLHHGRDLPIDLTEFVRLGDNKLKVLVNRTSKDTSSFRFAIAVERIGVLSHETIVKGVDRKAMSAEASLAAIKNSLTGVSSVEGKDDGYDIVMTSSTLTVKLFDPITAAGIFTTPVRSRFCLHRDPFDLDTFLRSRRRLKPGWPAEVDTWLCPICRGPASPQYLVKDGFFVQVREQLERQGMLETRMITVQADGSWEAKEEARSGVRSASLEREEAAAANAPTINEQKQEPIVIELDD